MRRSACLVPLAAVLALAGCAAEAADRAFPTGGFDRIASSVPYSVPYDVHVRTGQAPGVRASGPSELLDRLRVEVHGGELQIGMRPGKWLSGWRSNGHLTIEVGVPMLRAAALSGPGDLAVDHVRTPDFAAVVRGPGDLAVQALEARQLTVQLSGPGDVTLAGRVDHATFRLSGPGDIRAANLVARDALIDLSGPGDLTAGVTGTAGGTLSGPGDITIRGGARCTISKHGPGDVHCG